MTIISFSIAINVGMFALLNVKVQLSCHTFNHASKKNVYISLLDSEMGGPPQNIRAWIRFVTACCLIRYATAGSLFRV